MRRLFYALAGALVATGASSGCSLLTDLSGVSGGDDDDRGEASTPTGDGGSTTADGATSSDADATTELDAAPDAGCLAMKATFCDDFERADVLGPWESVVQQGPTTIAIEGAAGNRRLRATAGAASDGVEPRAFLSKQYATQASHFVIGADVSYGVAPLGAAEYRLVWKLYNTFGTKGLQLLYLSVEDSSVSLIIQEIEPNPAIVVYDVSLPVGTRRNVRLDTEVGGQTVVSVDGMPVHSSATPSFVVPAVPRIEAGIVSGPFPSSPFDVTLDNLVFGAE